MAKPGPERDEITVIVPPEPPELNPEAARVLLSALSREVANTPTPAKGIDRRIFARPGTCPSRS
jgi:hypothetical protein